MSFPHRKFKMKNIYLSMNRSPFLFYVILYGLLSGANPNGDQKLYKYKSASYFGGEVIVKFHSDLKLGENKLLKTGKTSVDALLDQFQMIHPQDQSTPSGSHPLKNAIFPHL